MGLGWISLVYDDPARYGEALLKCTMLPEESDKAGARLGPQRSSVCAGIGRRW